MMFFLGHFSGQNSSNVLEEFAVDLLFLAEKLKCSNFVVRKIDEYRIPKECQ